MATAYDIIAFQGTSLNLAIPATDGSGILINLSGCSVSGAVKYQYSSTGALLDLSPSVVSPGTGGVVSISIPGSGLTGLPVIKALYDINLYSGVDFISKLFTGYFNVYPSVT